MIITKTIFVHIAAQRTYYENKGYDLSPYMYKNNKLKDKFNIIIYNTRIYYIKNLINNKRRNLILKTIDEFYDYMSSDPSDINEHIPTLKRYSEGCENIIELGVKAVVSTWGLLAGKPKNMISVDIYHPSYYGGNLNEVYEACKLENIDFTFLQKNDLEIDLESADLLFIDTAHAFFQLFGELYKHGTKTKKYIIMHDTNTYRNELWPAINSFLATNKEWKVLEEFTNNNGLTILGKTSNVI
jgi:hypothetical protein